MQENINFENLNALEMLDKDDLVKLVKKMATGGIAIMFNGKRSAMEIQKKVRPRVVTINKKLSIGNPIDQADNVLSDTLQSAATANYFLAIQA